MKKKLGILLTFLIAMSFSVFAQENQEATGSFGEEINAKGAVSAKKLSKKMEKADSLDLKVKGEISEVCQAKGCWMTLDLGDGETVRVKFKDYGFFVPKNSAGHMAIISGTAKKEVVSVKELKHLAEDAGKSEKEINAITEPKEELTFIADGVIIK